MRRIPLIVKAPSMKAWFKRRFGRIQLMHNRRGVALILTLGLLSLMLVLTLSFAMSALHSQKSAQYGVELTRARQYAESGLQRIIASLKTELIDTTDFNNYYPGTKNFMIGTGDWSNYYYTMSMVNPTAGETQMTDSLLSSLALSIDGLTYVPNSAPAAQTSTGATLNLSGIYSWLPMYEKRTINDTQVTVISGRYAFVVIDESGKIDPNSAVDTQYTEGTEVSSGYNKGQYMSEVSLLDLGFSSSYAAKLRSTAVTGGLMPSSAKWYDRFHIAKTTGLTTAGDQTTTNKIIQTMFPYRRPDTLTNQLETTSDGYTVTYNLNGMIPTSTGDNGSDIRNKIVLANLTTSPKQPGIKWLENWSDAGSFATPEAHANNIAANIKDYIDTNYDASRDASNPGGGSYPTYWGMERVPYISRLQVTVRNLSTSSGSNVTPILGYYVRPELINMWGNYATEHANNCWIEVRGNVSMSRWDASNSVDQSFTLTFNPFSVNSPSTSSVTANISGDFTSSGYVRLNATTVSSRLQHGLAGTFTGTTFNRGSTSSTTAKQLRNVKVRVTSIMLCNSSTSEKWDFAMPMSNGSSTWSNAVSTLGTTTSTDEQYFLFQAYNPMNNLFPADWQLTGPSTTDLMTTGSSSMPSLWSDVNKKLYIRNNTMQHLVEMGAIYRMDPYDSADLTKSFRTLNLIDYKYNGDNEVPQDYADATDGVVDNYDGDLLDTEGNGGDRNILDMVRLGTENTAEREMIGRININSRNQDVLRSIFRRVTAAKYTTNDAISQSQADGIVTNIMAKTVIVANQTPKANGPVPIGLVENNRNPMMYGLLFQKAALAAQGSTSTLTEDQIEHLICQTMQLVNGKHNYFTCIVVAQVIKDVGAVMPENLPASTSGYTMKINGVDARIGRYDAGADAILAEQKIMVVLYRSAVTNQITVERFDYLDE